MITGLWSRHRINPPPTRFVWGKASEYRWRPRRYQVYPCSRGREVARGVQLSSPKRLKRSIFVVGEGSKSFVACFLHNSAQMCLYQTPGRRPLRITSRFVNTAMTTVQIFLAQSLVLSIDICRWLGISPLRITFWWSFLWAILAQHLPRNFFFRFFFWELWFGTFLGRFLCS